MLVQYGTYVEFSWDIMEPITCAMTMGDAVIAYFFWLWYKNPYSLNGIYQSFFNRKRARLIKKHKLDIEAFEKTEEAIKIIKNRLDELS